MSDPWIPPAEGGGGHPGPVAWHVEGEGASPVEGGITWIGGCYPYRVYPWRGGGDYPQRECYPWRVVVPVEGDVTRGGWCYPWRVVLPVEGGVTRGGWCYPWRRVLPVEEGVTRGGGEVRGRRKGV